tara:strand:+ start:31796 stop:32269 length:474 start_codon:yes stop_codon:yes gene_type:complete
MPDQVYTVSQAVEKAMKYCAYQERCQQEVRQKLHSFQLTSIQREEVIMELINQDFLNEERYSQAFARGKFRMKAWGKKKITLALKQKEISEYCIRKGMAEIDEKEYNQTLATLIRKTYDKNKGVQEYQRVAKTAQYVIGRGFEAHLVWDQLKTLAND